MSDASWLSLLLALEASVLASCSPPSPCGKPFDPVLSSYEVLQHMMSVTLLFLFFWVGSWRQRARL